MDVYALQERVIEGILADVTQQQATALVSKPVAQEQAVVSQILRENMNNPALNRAEVRELRNFLKQPLVGASVRTLREALKQYNVNNSPQPLVEAVRELHSQQGEIIPQGMVERPVSVSREDLHLICYEYICC
jgi:hypothetical protein